MKKIEFAEFEKNVSDFFLSGEFKVLIDCITQAQSGDLLRTSMEFQNNLNRIFSPEGIQDLMGAMKRAQGCNLSKREDERLFSWVVQTLISPIMLLLVLEGYLEIDVRDKKMRFRTVGKTRPEKTLKNVNRTTRSLFKEK